MSFILDALKKSESDRQRQSGPSLFEVKVAPPRRKLPIWAAAIAVLLGINIVVISWMLLRHPTSPETAPTRAPATVPAPAAAPARAAPTAAYRTAPAPSTADPSTATTVTTPAGGFAPTGAPADGPSRASRGSPGQPAMTASSPSFAPPAGGTDRSASQPEGANGPSDYAPAVEPSSAPASGASRAAGGDLPLYQQIATSTGVPELHLDLHVYADRPKDRFVMINMHRLGEGDSLPSGVQVDAIRPDGVVLSYHGTRFLLPRN